MRKEFCDLCGQPACDMWPILRVTFPELKWTGIKFDPGSVANVEGTYEPRIEARLIFDSINASQRMTSPHRPDLCPNCIAGLLRQMADSITQPPLP